MSVAEVAGLEGWEVDRLLFNFRDKALRRYHSQAVVSAENYGSPLNIHAAALVSLARQFGKVIRLAYRIGLTGRIDCFSGN